MKKLIKITLGIIGFIILIIAIDLICIFTINKPLLAIKSKCEDCYSGIFYDTYKCDENEKIQIKLKSNKFECPLTDISNEIKIIVDNTDVCAMALEKFYEDKEYEYYFNCIKSGNVMVIYTDGSKENIKIALANNKITIKDLDRFKIKYTKKIIK